MQFSTGSQCSTLSSSHGKKNAKCLWVREKRFGTLSTDLSKAFDCLSHDLIIGKSNVSGFSLSALKLIHNWRKERKK